MLDLRPGVAALTQASYNLELRGRLSDAAALMRRALDAAFSPADVAYCRTGWASWRGRPGTSLRRSDSTRECGRPPVVPAGATGGLAPSLSALITLLGAIALGRAGFGVVLVIGYGVGMAAALTAAGLLVLRLRDRWVGRYRTWSRWARPAARLSAAAPAATASLVLLLVGLGLAGRAIAAMA